MPYKNKVEHSRGNLKRSDLIWRLKRAALNF